MGLIFDIHSAKLYESWHQSPKGKDMDRFVERLVPELLEPKKYERVLDIGCGKGNHLLFFNKLGLDISGIDASPYMIDLAKKRLGNRCTLKTGMAEDLPFDDNEFDLVLLINTLEFLDNPLQALREAGRVANRKVLIVVMNSLSLNCMGNRIRCLFRKTIYGHVKSYNIWELKSHLHAAYGPMPVEWRGEGGWPSILRRTRGFSSGTSGLSAWPFGSILGLSVKIKYRVKTDNIPLKIRVRKSEQPLAGGITTIRSRDILLDGIGVHSHHERSLSL